MKRGILRLLAPAALTAATLMSTPIGTVAADPCPDVEVVFARGTSEPPGVGAVGQGFVDALRGDDLNKSVRVYAVNYLASDQFGDRVEFARSVVDGIRDAGARVQSTAQSCPSTRIVLGGFSQGAVVAGFVTADRVPDGVPAEFVPAPLPPEVADHVAAVTLFGMPSASWMQSYGAPPVTIGSRYADKTIELCAPGDTICDGTPGAAPSLAHLMYPVNGLVGQAAAYTAGRL